jgi:hypothetical protein
MYVGSLSDGLFRSGMSPNSQRFYLPVRFIPLDLIILIKHRISETTNEVTELKTMLASKRLFSKEGQKHSWRHGRPNTRLLSISYAQYGILFQLT